MNEQPMSPETSVPVFGPEHAELIQSVGTAYRKRTTIFAVPAPSIPCLVRTTEGMTTLGEPGVIATDGISVWPISATFMRDNYDPVP